MRQSGYSTASGFFCDTNLVAVLCADGSQSAAGGAVRSCVAAMLFVCAAAWLLFIMCIIVHYCSAFVKSFSKKFLHEACEGMHGAGS